ncbi:hypothetical protein E2I00_014826, partial [Balaenoptera physalus]
RGLAAARTSIGLTDRLPPAGHCYVYSLRVYSPWWAILRYRRRSRRVGPPWIWRCQNEGRSLLAGRLGGVGRVFSALRTGAEEAAVAPGASPDTQTHSYLAKNGGRKPRPQLPFNKTLQRNRKMAMGRKKFNMDPKKGIQFLVENELLQNTPEEIARFLYKGEGLNKTAIGDYLGERQFLWSFRLPGEAQKIDRMMEAFAQRYCLCNPGVFQSTDTCYVLSFAVIMLNTSLHNPNVRDKPGLERFVAMNRGINEGGDLPEELLRNLYDSIRNEPFKIPEDDGNDLTHTFFNPDREGWLLKLGAQKQNCFELYIRNNKGQLIKACKTEADGRVVEGNHMVYRISAPTQEEKDEWIKSIQVLGEGVAGGPGPSALTLGSRPFCRAAVSVDPFYEMLAARKKRISVKKKQEQP